MLTKIKVYACYTIKKNQTPKKFQTRGGGGGAPVLDPPLAVPLVTAGKADLDFIKVEYSPAQILHFLH